MGALETVRHELTHNERLRSLIDRILERCERRGLVPSQLTLRGCDARDYDAAVRLLSPSAVNFQAQRSRLVLNLKRAEQLLQESDGDGTSLLGILCAVTERQPRNLRQERDELVEAATAVVARLAGGCSGITYKFLTTCGEQLRQYTGPVYALLQGGSPEVVETEMRVIVAALEAALTNTEPVRLANFSRKVTGSTKGFRSRSFRYGVVADALLRYVPGLAEYVDAESPKDRAMRRRMALEYFSIFRNETAVDVLCCGDFELERDGTRYDAPALHYAAGESVRLLLPHLRNARVSRCVADRLVIVENETTYNDYVDWMRSRLGREVVVCSGGQPNSAVIHLLKLLAAATPGVPILFWGDMDRGGVWILRSLMRKTVLSVEPLWMDCATYFAHRQQGLPLSAGERTAIARLLASEDETVCKDLLEAILSEGVWIEQEAVAESVLQMI